MSTYNYEQLFSMELPELIEWLHEEFLIELPSKITSAAEMEEASELMLQLTGYYSYLAELLSYAKIAVRMAKRERSKMEWEDMVDRKEVIERKLDTVKQQYNALSRAITVKTEANKEMFMSGG